jgi:hypothetical protein
VKKTAFFEVIQILLHILGYFEPMIGSWYDATSLSPSEVYYSAIGAYTEKNDRANLEADGIRELLQKRLAGKRCYSFGACPCLYFCTP